MNIRNSLLLLFSIYGLCLLSGCGGAGGSSIGSNPQLHPRLTVTHLSVSGPTSAASGTAISFIVSAMDASNVIVTNYSGTVHFSSSDIQAVLPHDSALSSGRGNFSATFKTTGSQSISATDTVTATILGVSNTIQVASVASNRGFVATGSMAFARKDHTATRLKDSRVLVTGGNGRSGLLAAAELFDPASGAFSLTGSMDTARAGHSATLLEDGRVLVAGGGTATAELFDPASGTFVRTGDMGTARTGHTATLLKDGRVLVAGGGTATTELFDPTTGQFAAAGNMLGSRSYHTATLLSTGAVLIAGGPDSGGTALGELFDPTTNSFVPTASGGTSSLHLAAALLPDGKVFLAGGEQTVLISGGSTRCCVTGPVSFALAILFDNSASSFSAVGDMSTSRSGLTLTLLPNGEVLITGGATIVTKAMQARAVTTVQPLASAELFNPASGTFSATGSMTTARTEHTATLLSNGKVLVVGGVDGNNNVIASAELYR